MAEEEILVGEIIDALDRLFDFFNRNLEHLIADGFVGIAIAQGQLKEAIPQTPTHLMPLVDQLILKSGQILDGFDPDVHGVPEIGRGMRVLLQPEMWMSKSKVHPLADKDLNPLSGAPGQSADECLGQLLASRAPCRISSGCWQMQALSPSENFSYSTTHHLFYYHIAKKLRCQVAGRDMDSLIAAACKKILAETQGIADAHFPEARRDLFLEQIALCGVAQPMGGDFTHSEWLREVLKWQKPLSGCYGLNSSRVKRNEKLMPSGCLVHFSSVAAAALATGLKSLIITF
ncbi:UPF0764 protein C16orf89 homolog [Neocloeon triangulifer]|uniref:UPF0764 protein C16orf89 homolog n=1 Tax=Neocloeon triangulifer TaxID=2078957 RepID=UPI00286EBE60|nr:UPF0764 protein C16orf89 homolog [Neocloeon triangulifer]